MRPDDLIVTVAYFSIPIQIVGALLRYPRLRAMPWSIVVLAILFALFIFLCGTGHLFRCLELTSGSTFHALNNATAFISLATALYLVPLVPHLFESLDNALAAEKESKRKLMTFMSFLCHEIRNPLFAITSAITFMGDDTSFSEEQQSSLQCIEQSANLMLRLVNDVLDLSKLESGRLQLEKRHFDLIKMCECAAASFKSTVALKSNGAVTFGMYVTPEVPRQAIGDSVRILQVIFNLLSNSAKFTQEGFINFSVDVVSIKEAARNKWIDSRFGELPAARTASTSASVSEDDERASLKHSSFTSNLLLAEEGLVCAGYGGECSSTVVFKLNVSDSGPGISIERQKNIFEPYSQAKLSDYRKHGGTGLGLSIVTRLTETMGGTIHLQSHEGHGSSFTIYLPLNVVTPGLEPNADIIPLAPRSVSDDELASSVRKMLDEHDIQGGIELTKREDSTGRGSLHSIGITQAESLNLFNTVSTSDRQVLNCPELDSATDPSKFTINAVGTERSDPTSSGPLVLVVDDNGVNRKLLGRMLNHAKLKHCFAEDGREAVDFMKSSRNYTGDSDSPTVGLVLMDWSMPTMDGCQATRAIRTMNLSVPIVALTACALEDGLQELIDAGANEIATKPIIRDDLLRICRKYLV